MTGPLLSEWYIVAASAVHARPLETIRSSTTRCTDRSGSRRYRAAIGRQSWASSIVPAKNRPSGETLPSLKRVPGTGSGPPMNSNSPVSRSSSEKPSSSATTAPPDSRSPNEPMRLGIGQLRSSPVSGSSRCRAGARMSTQYSARSSATQTGHSPSSARASSTQLTSAVSVPAVVASAMSGLQLSGDLLPHPPVDLVGLLFPAEHADRRDAVEVQLPEGGEELLPVDV